MKIGFIGAGKVGFTLGKFFAARDSNDFRVAGYYSRSIQSAREAAEFTESAAFAAAGELAAACDVLFLTVPDSSLASCYAALCGEHPDLHGKILCHCSGALTAGEVFRNLEIEHTGAAGYSVHPLCAVSDRYRSYREIADVFFAIEGTAARLPEVQRWLTTAGLHVQAIAADAKRKYHCAAAIASNQVAALLAQSLRLFVECGFTEDSARAALAPLFLGNAQHLAESGPVDALTGPVERGDCTTVAAHLASLGSAADRMLYLLLSQKLTDLAKKKHPERDYRPICQQLAEEIAALIPDL